ncbi:GDP-mannose 4,6-dehydratase, partial [Pelagibacteraceae bacterium]|nr:GDP-mannose 4,6-dehydratase [Pelagibacteraceae bacterium]
IVPSVENPKKYFSTNTMGTINILEGARQNSINKFVYAASSSCYGLAKTPTKENDLISPKYPYALSKYIGESYAFHWNKVYNLPTISIRIFNAYGTRVRTTGAYGAVFGVFLKQKLSGKPFTVVGDGNQSRDFIYVTDICNAFYKVSTSKYTCEVFNVGEGKPKKINYLVKLLGGGEIIYLPERPGEPKKTLADIKKIQKYTNWKPKIKFENGVAMMIKNINDWRNAPLWNKNSIDRATKAWFKYLK